VAGVEKQEIKIPIEIQKQAVDPVSSVSSY
jgi:hypothetical protein